MSVFLHKNKLDAVLGAFSHKRRTCTRIAESHYPLNVVERNSADLGFAITYDEIFTVKRKISVGIVDIDRVHQLFQAASPLFRRFFAEHSFNISGGVFVSAYHGQADIFQRAGIAGFAPFHLWSMLCFV